jgi:hypothetical protein
MDFVAFKQCFSNQMYTSINCVVDINRGALIAGNHSAAVPIMAYDLSEAKKPVLYDLSVGSGACAISRIQQKTVSKQRFGSAYVIVVAPVPEPISGHQCVPKIIATYETLFFNEINVLTVFFAMANDRPTSGFESIGKYLAI